MVDGLYITDKVPVYIGDINPEAGDPEPRFRYCPQNVGATYSMKYRLSLFFGQSYRAQPIQAGIQSFPVASEFMLQHALQEIPHAEPPRRGQGGV